MATDDAFTPADQQTLRRLYPVKHEGFTPGPWRVERRPSNHLFPVAEVDTLTIEASMPIGDPRTGKPIADARLIADAPNLVAECTRLAALNARLVEALKGLREVIRDEGPDHISLRWSQADDAASEAIEAAKAAP